MHMYQLMYTKLRCLRCFNSSLFKSQVTNVLTEVVPFCKLGHIYYQILKLCLSGTGHCELAHSNNSYIYSS